MYEKFYGLRSKPFQLNPDPTFYFGSSQHRRAKAYLDYGVLRNEGFIVVTGEIGAGKTTVVRGLLDSLDASRVVAAQLVSTQLDAEDALRMVAAAFGVRTRDVSKADLLMALEVFFVSQAGQGKRCLLVVDEAQNLTSRAVEELRMLSNFQFGNQALLQTFLVGQPEFRTVLQDPNMRQLRQRVVAACHIGPLDLQETKLYILHRLHTSGGTGRPAFDEGVFDSIFQLTGGIPRSINSICDRLLLSGFLGKKETLTVDDVSEVEAGICHEAGQESSSAWSQRFSRSNVGTQHQNADGASPEHEIANSEAFFHSKTGLGWPQRIEQALSRLEGGHSAILLEIEQIRRICKPTDVKRSELP